METAIRFVCECVGYINKEVVDGVQEGDETHCGKRKFAIEEYTKNKLNKYRK
jgi:hypothetical protein